MIAPLATQFAADFKVAADSRAILMVLAKSRVRIKPDGQDRKTSVASSVPVVALPQPSPDTCYTQLVAYWFALVIRIRSGFQITICGRDQALRACRLLSCQDVAC